MPKVRLHVAHPLGEGQTVPLTEAQAHYLFGVMRLGPGAAVHVFDGRSGEWRAEVAEAGRRGGSLRLAGQTAAQRDPADLWLLFAPVKKARTDFIVEKATELGVARILPVQTAYTNAERVRRERLAAHAVEAAEQCGATHVPEVADLAPLARVLDGLGNRRLLFCDEAAGGGPDLAGAEPGPWAILVGPEGGFAPEERDRIRALPGARAVGLGPRILRAETAAVAALTLWQAALGDWRDA